MSAGTECRASAGVCDVAEQCTGSSASCPFNRYLSSATVCRPTGAGTCDVAETCTGSSASCPPDGCLTSQSCSECGYSGTQTCDGTCNWANCGNFSFSRYYDNVEVPFTHSCGYNCGDGLGDWCILGAPGGGCDLISGGPSPSITAPPGRYRADFYWGDVGTHDFYAYVNGVLAGSATYTNSSSSSFPHVYVNFTIAAGTCGTITLRIRSRAGARIRLYSIRIDRTGN